MDEKISLFEMFITLVALVSSAAGLKLFKLFYKWSYDKRRNLRSEWRGDLLYRIETLETELLAERKVRAEVQLDLTKYKVKNAILEEKLKNYENV